MSTIRTLVEHKERFDLIFCAHNAILDCTSTVRDLALTLRAGGYTPSSTCYNLEDVKQLALDILYNEYTDAIAADGTVPGMKKPGAEDVAEVCVCEAVVRLKGGTKDG